MHPQPAAAAPAWWSRRLESSPVCPRAYRHHLPPPPVPRADAKTALYQQAIKQGDLLLNRVQKLSKIIDIE